MLESYYDFLDRYFDRRDLELIQMDTNSNYIATSAASSETSFTQSCTQNSKQKRSSGLRGTSGAGAHQGCSNSKVKATG